MASLLTKLEEQLTCSVCLEQFKNPKVLPCLHSFCHHCILKLAKDNSNSITCPDCRATLELGNPPDISFLPSNFLVNNLLATMADCEPGEKAETDGKSASLCKQCNTGVWVDNTCMVCEVSLCCLCTQAHLLSESTKNHRFTPVGESKSSGANVLGCSKHNNEKITLFCTLCKEVICKLCAEGTHLDHGCSVIEDVASEEKDEMRDVLERVKNMKDELSQRLSNVSQNEERLTAKRESVIPEIVEYFDNLSKVVERRRNELVEEVTYLTNSRLKELIGPREHLELTITSCARSIENASEAFATEDDARILSQQSNIHECLTFVNNAMEQKCPIVEDSLEFVPGYSVREIGEKFVENLRVLGDFACPKKSTASFRESKLDVQLATVCVVTVFCKDKLGRGMTHGGQSVTPIFTGVQVKDVSVRDNQDGTFNVKFVAKNCGTLTFQALINGHLAPNCILNARVNWVMREDIGSGIISGGGLTLTGDSVMGGWCYRVGLCSIEADVLKWKVEVRYLGSHSHFGFKKKIEVGVIDSDGGLTHGAVKSGVTKKWVVRCSAQVIVTLRLDMSQNTLTVQSTGGLDGMNNSIPPSQNTFHIEAKRVSPFLALRGNHLCLKVIHI